MGHLLSVSMEHFMLSALAIIGQPFPIIIFPWLCVSACWAWIAAIPKAKTINTTTAIAISFFISSLLFFL
jgi:hypothetical protein